MCGRENCTGHGETERENAGSGEINRGCEEGSKEMQEDGPWGGPWMKGDFKQ